MNVLDVVILSVETVERLHTIGQGELDVRVAGKTIELRSVCSTCRVSSIVEHMHGKHVTAEHNRYPAPIYKTSTL